MDRICTECETGGDLLCCDGPCQRSFHLECLKMKKVPSGDMWCCSDCGKHVHRCFTCGIYGKDDSLVKCSKCGRFFHMECIGDSCVWNPPKDDDGLPEFVCGSHACHECGRDNPHTRCFRCGIAYHQECRPPDVHDLDDDYFLCIKHIQADLEKSSSKQEEEVEEEQEEEKKKKLELAPKRKRSLSDSTFLFQDIGVIGDASAFENRKNTKPIEEGDIFDVSGINVDVFDHAIPECAKCKKIFDCGWSHKLGIFVVIDAEIHNEDRKEYRHKRGSCSRKYKRLKRKR